MGWATVTVTDGEGKKMDTTNVAPNLRREGNQITIPVGWTIEKAIDWLYKMESADGLKVGLNEVFDCNPFEGALALRLAIDEKFGFVSLQNTPTFFGPRPPTMVQVESGVGETTSVPWGRMELQGVRGWLVTQIQIKNGRPVFALTGEFAAGDMDQVKDITTRIRRILKENSLYKGKAFRISFPLLTPDTSIEDFLPKFIDVTKVVPENLILADDVAEIVESSLFAVVKYTDACREADVPLKRGILLEGPYGCGKTLTANVAAKLCTDNGWTFIYLESASDLPRALDFAKNYQPAMIFAEDVDRDVSGKRDAEMDAILNTLDGIETKNADIVVVLTSNFPETINKAMIRPGRIDAVIPIRAPDAKAVERLVRSYGKGLVASEADLTDVGIALAGNIPAVIREVVERAKLTAIVRNHGNGKLTIIQADLLAATRSMKAHLELLKEQPVDKRSDVEKFGEVVGSYVRDGIAKAKTNGLAKVEPDSIPGPTT